MSLDISKLQNTRTRGKKITARCPACAESGHDHRGEHLFIDTDGRFGCVVYPGDSSDAKAHRKRIFALCGCREIRPLCVRPAEETATPGRLGRVAESQTVVAPLKTALLGRLGRAFQTHSEQSHSPENAKDFFPVRERSNSEQGVLAVLETSLRPHRPLTERERTLLIRFWGTENNPIILTALNLFNGVIVG